ADAHGPPPASRRSNAVQPPAFVAARVERVVPRGDPVEEPPGLRGPLDDGHDLRTAPSHLKSRAVPAKSISRGDRWRGTHGEGGGQARGGTGSDEVVEGVFGSCAAVPSGRSNGECEILRPVPDRDATGPRVPPLGSRRHAVQRPMPDPRYLHPRTVTARPH